MLFLHAVHYIYNMYRARGKSCVYGVRRDDNRLSGAQNPNCGGHAEEFPSTISYLLFVFSP